MKPAYEVADVLRKNWPAVETHPQINTWQLRTLGAVMRCRTAEMGGHVDACTNCGTIQISYNSCRNRHCPKCQGKKREEWIKKREAELLPVPYFHVVFTLPDLLNPLTLYKSREVYDTLFETAWDTIKTFAKDEKHLGAKAGMVCILHTWGQTLTLHPHLHCVVPGGGITKAGNWKMAKAKGKYLFPVKAMSPVFRGKFMEALREKVPIEKQLADELFKKNWVVYAKQPFGNPECVMEYLGRYTHKIAISNHRIKSIENGKITFGYKDYRKGAQKQEMELESMEFIRRFAMHILPKAYVRIRHYGILSGTAKRKTLPEIKAQLPEKPMKKEEIREITEFKPGICPHCKTETMVTIEFLFKRGPPMIC